MGSSSPGLPRAVLVAQCILGNAPCVQQGWLGECREHSSKGERGESFSLVGWYLVTSSRTKMGPKECFCVVYMYC